MHTIFFTVFLTFLLSEQNLSKLEHDISAELAAMKVALNIM